MTTKRIAPELRTTAYGLRGDSPIDRPHPIFSLFIALFGFVMIAFPVGTSWGSGALNLLFLTPFVLFGLVFMLVGVWVIIGSRRVIVKRGRLKLWYGFGPFGVPIPLPQKDMDRLRVRRVKTASGGSDFDKPYELVAELSRDGKKGRDHIQLAAGDDPAWLSAWAEQIGDAIGAEYAVMKSLRPKAEAHGVSVPLPPEGAVYPEPPITSPFSLEERPGHITLFAAMDRSARRRSQSFIGMGVAFISLIVLVGGGFVVSGAYSSLPVAIGLGSMTLLFFLAGLTMLGYGVLITRDKWIVDITDGTLLATFTHLGRRRTRQIPASEVSSVRVEETGESWGGSSMNDGPAHDGIPVKELRIAPRSGPQLRLLTGCSDTSLEWARRVLSIALAVTPIDGTAETDDDA